MKRREFICLIGGLAVAWPVTAHAQQPAMPMVGVLSSQSAAAVARPLSEFQRSLSKLGYDDRKTVGIEYRWADGQYDRLPALAADRVLSFSK